MTPDAMLAHLRSQPWALSIRQPWAWRILREGKDIENRTWTTPFRGPVLIHAGVQPDGPLADLPPDAHRGGIVGMARVVDCILADDPRAKASAWWQGPVGFVLADAHPLTFVPCPGRLGFFSAGIDARRLSLADARPVP
jgi:hypothetical protein